MILRRHVQSGFVTIPKSTNPDHIAANLDVFDVALTEDDMAAITALDKGRPHHRIRRWLQEMVLPGSVRANSPDGRSGAPVAGSWQPEPVDQPEPGDVRGRDATGAGGTVGPVTDEQYDAAHDA